MDNPATFADLCESSGIFRPHVLHVDLSQLAGRGVGIEELKRVATVELQTFNPPRIEDTADLDRFEAAGGTRPLEGEARAEHWRLRIAQTLSPTSGWGMHHGPPVKRSRSQQGRSGRIR